MPYRMGGACSLPIDEPISNDVPSPEYNDKCATRKGNSACLVTSIQNNRCSEICTYGTMEFPEESLIVNCTMIGGVNGSRDKFAVPKAAVLMGC